MPATDGPPTHLPPRCSLPPRQVPLGSCTPLALAQPSAANVALLLDDKLRGQDRVFVHPLENTATTVLSAAGLEAFLRCAPAGHANTTAGSSQILYTCGAR